MGIEGAVGEPTGTEARVTGAGAWVAVVVAEGWELKTEVHALACSDRGVRRVMVGPRTEHRERETEGCERRIQRAYARCTWDIMREG